MSAASPERGDSPRRLTTPIAATVNGRSRVVESSDAPLAHESGEASVLIVDDDADVRLTLRTVLRRSPRFRVVAEAKDGEQALEFVREARPDIVLLDLMLPRRDGRDVAPVIFRDSPQTMIVVLSALPAAAEAGSLLGQGAFAYVEKTEMGPRLADGLEALWVQFRGALAGEDVWAPSAGRDPLR